MMSLFRRRSNAAPGPVTNNGLTLNQANAALTNALHKVANVKLRNALKAAKNVANASAANKNARIKELEKALAEAKPVVTAATNAAPNKPADAATQNAEVAAVNAVARNAAALANFNARITAANNRAKLTQIEVNLQNYASKHNIPYSRNNIKKRLNAVNTKRNNIQLQPHPLQN
jgi:hypothetical protein